MKLSRLLVLVLLLVPTIAMAQKKKPKTPAALAQARYVYVEAMDGDAYNPSLLPDDREAIFAVQDALREWKRYSITMNRKDAELVFVVRVGRRAAAKLGGGIGNAPPTVGTPQQGQPASRAGQVMIGGEAGPADDLLQVYLMNPDKGLGTMLWERTEHDGLLAPDVTLVRDLKKAVERDYPSTTASDKH